MSGRSKRQSEESKSSAEADLQLSLPIVREGEKKEMSESPEKDFEETLAELETIVQKLEGELKLEEALSLFDKGMELSQYCQGFLKSAEQKIEVLKRAADGKLISEGLGDETVSGVSTGS